MLGRLVVGRFRLHQQSSPTQDICISSSYMYFFQFGYLICPFRDLGPKGFEGMHLECYFHYINHEFDPCFSSSNPNNLMIRKSSFYLASLECPKFSRYKFQFIKNLSFIICLYVNILILPKTKNIQVSSSIYFFIKITHFIYLKIFHQK